MYATRQISFSVRWMPAWITTQRKSEIMNVAANSSEIMFDSILVGPFHFRVVKGPLRENVVASLRIAFKD